MNKKCCKVRAGVRTLCFKVVVAALAGGAFQAMADYPLVVQRYLADPDALVYNGRVYLYCSNDDDNHQTNYVMHSIVCVSSDDLKNWTDHGVVFTVPADASWASKSWAPSVAYRNSKFYLYFGNNASGIGVATNSSPTGEFKDALGGYLVNNKTAGAAGSNMWYFDPCVFIDTNSQAYLYFGGDSSANLSPTNAKVIKLNSDMVSVSGSAMPVGSPTYFMEASHMHQRNGTYYFSYESHATGGSLWIRYMSSSSPTNGFVYKTNILYAPYNANNNHQSLFTYSNAEYVAYHNRYLANVRGLTNTTYSRNICLDSVTYNSDGTIKQITCTSNGVTQLKNLNPYTQVEAETMASESGINTETCSEGGLDVGYINNGDWIEIKGVAFGSAGASSFSARVASVGSGGNIELRLDSLSGTLIGTCPVSATGGWQTWATDTCTVSSSLANGVHDLYLKFTGGSGNLFNINWWKFAQ